MDNPIDFVPPINHSVAMVLPLVVLVICFTHDKLINFLETRRKRREEQAKLIAALSSSTEPSSPPPTCDLTKRKVLYNIKKGASRYPVYGVN